MVPNFSWRGDEQPALSAKPKKTKHCYRAYARNILGAGWSSPVARQAHNLKVAGSNPAPATNYFFLITFLFFPRSAQIGIRVFVLRPDDGSVLSIFCLSIGVEPTIGPWVMPLQIDLKVIKAELTPYPLKFKNGKIYQSAVTVMTAVDHRLLHLTFDHGLTAIGEVARYPLYNTSDTEALEDAALVALQSAAFGDIPAIVEAWRLRAPALRGMAFALDCVWHQLTAQDQGCSLSSLLGGPGAGEVPEVLSLSAAPQQDLIHPIRTDGQSRRVVQIKLGVADLDEEMTTVERLLPLMKDDQLLLADFNGALSQETALEILPRLTDPKLLWEEPCPTLDENLTVACALKGQMMIDTCLTDLNAYEKAIAAGVQAVAIKPALMGGLAAARAARDRCVSAGLRLRVDGPWSGQIAACAALSLAIAVPSHQMIGSIDLTQALDTENDQILRPRPGWIGIDDMRSQPKPVGLG